MIVEAVNEITFYLSNQVGELSNVSKAFDDSGVNIKGLLVGEGFGKSVIRVVVDKEDEATRILEGLGIDDISKEPILAVRMPSKPGVLGEMSDRLSKANINIENIYVTESPQGDTVAYVSVPDVDGALRVFE